MNTQYSLQLQSKISDVRALLASETDPVKREALELYHRKLIALDNSVRVSISLSREIAPRYDDSLPPSIKSACKADVEFKQDSSHWSFDEATAKKARLHQRIVEKFHNLFGRIPDPFIIRAAVSLGGFKQLFDHYSLSHFLLLPESTRKLLAPQIFSTILSSLRK